MAAKALILLPILAERVLSAGLTHQIATPKMNVTRRLQIAESPACRCLIFLLTT
jgi:hypothetical protein